MGEVERQLLLDAFDSNWVAPLGPHVDAFEQETASYVGVAAAAATSSGTAALHLALILSDVRPGDRVFCSTLTFAASANPIAYCRAEPVFIDSSSETWNMDPDLLEEELERSARKGALPKAVIVVDLYGQTADYARLEKACNRFDVPLIEDAAEALGATHGDRRAGSFGKISVLSFNGNKIITTGGGGMLLSNDADIVRRARFLATQARDAAPHYQHSTLGYNYRLSNLLAAIGRGQLVVLAERVAARRAVFDTYVKALANMDGVTFMPEASYGRSNRWLTCMTIDPKLFGSDRESIRTRLEAQDIEARPVWKPMHLQPIYRDCRTVGGTVSERIFEYGLCLPSGSNLTVADQERVIETVLSCRDRRPVAAG